MYGLASPCLMDTRGLMVTQGVYFSLLTHSQKLLLVTFHNTIAEIGDSFWKHRRRNTEGQTDVTVEIVI